MPKYSNNKIILWVENYSKSPLEKEFLKYAEIRFFSLMEEKKGLFLESYQINISDKVSFYSDVVRYILLYKYGGMWFDLDCLFLRNFNPLFNKFGDSIMVYQWENQLYPNGAIYISLIPLSEDMKHNINFIIKRNRGWGFQEAKLTYNLPLKMLVLPCSWFDALWIEKSILTKFEDFFKYSSETINLENFFSGAFCFHWHNCWDCVIEKNSPIAQLSTNIDDTLKN